MISELVIITEALTFSPRPLDAKEVLCVARAVYHEARAEEIDGQIAVVQVVMNRQKNRDKTACQVVYEKNQFSWTNKKAHVNLRDPQEKEAFETAVEVAVETMTGQSDDVVGNASYFISKKIKRPSWTKRLKFVGIIGNHVFFAPKK